MTAKEVIQYYLDYSGMPAADLETSMKDSALICDQSSKKFPGDMKTWYRDSLDYVYLILSCARNILDSSNREAVIKKYLKSGMKVLDYGAGSGIWTAMIHDLTGQGFFYDKNKYLTNFARWLVLNKGIFLMHEQTLQYDCICCFDVIEHLETPLSEVNTLCSFLPKGGLFIDEVTVDYIEGRRMHVAKNFEIYNHWETILPTSVPLRLIEKIPTVTNCPIGKILVWQKY